MVAVGKRSAVRRAPGRCRHGSQPHRSRSGLELDEPRSRRRSSPDGHEALLVDGGGIGRGNGTYFANAGNGVHAVGMLAPLFPGMIGCIVIRPDGSRYLARAMPDPMAQQKPD